jgi:hypothetical protein
MHRVFDPALMVRVLPSLTMATVPPGVPAELVTVTVCDPVVSLPKAARAGLPGAGASP